jgi:hypothetical protein
VGESEGERGSEGVSDRYDQHLPVIIDNVQPIVGLSTMATWNQRGTSTIALNPVREPSNM